MSAISLYNEGLNLSAVSRTYHYRKVMKPLLERKRRARINKCLDELKQLILEYVHFDEDTLSKLEKADILELTVQHLHSQRYGKESQLLSDFSQIDESIQLSEHFCCGFQQCILEISCLLQQHDGQINPKFYKFMQQHMPAGPIRFWRPWCSTDAARNL